MVQYSKIDRKKIKPKKSLGQHFLKNPRILKKIVSSINPKKDDNILEIGCGEGLLTELLAQSGAKIAAIEKDKELYEIAEERLKKYKNCKILKGDILKIDIDKLRNDYFSSRRIRVVGNIPYNISSQILFMMLEKRRLIEDIVFLIQKEMADRISAERGNSDYGYVSVAFAIFFKTSKIYNISGKSFFPPAKVESTLIHLIRLKQPKVKIDNEVEFLKFIKNCFSHRRKTIRNNIKMMLDNKKLEALEKQLSLSHNFNLSVRAEELDLFHFKKIYDIIKFQPG
ncbi:MAG: ribosomal RNA small subunit methyltransferase A [Candidatus Schekmanbacteria bacterium]|nr:MAG: ribosomal RNA small subunit methyltransferase A [Candidatus Schekmanbacteria bacterium]